MKTYLRKVTYSKETGEITFRSSLKVKSYRNYDDRIVVEVVNGDTYLLKRIDNGEYYTELYMETVLE